MIKKFIVTVFIISLCSLTYAENEDLIIYDDFSGGLDNHTNPFSFVNSTAQRSVPLRSPDCLNVRFNAEYRSLAKRDTLATYGTLGTNKGVGLYRYYISDDTKHLLGVSGANLKVGDDDTRTFTVLKDTGKNWFFKSKSDFTRTRINVSVNPDQ